MWSLCKPEPPVLGSRLVWSALVVSASILFAEARADWTSHITLATDSVHRGLSETSGDTSLAVGVDWAGERWFAGARLSNSQQPLPVNPENRSGQTVAAYAGYSWPIGSTWAAQWLVTRYEFTGDQSSVDGYPELAFNLSREQVGVEVVIAHDAWGQPGTTRYAAIHWQQPLTRWSDHLSVDVALGYANAERSLTWEYYYLELGASYHRWQWFLDARVHLLDDDRVNRRGWSDPKSRFVLSLGYQF